MSPLPNMIDDETLFDTALPLLAVLAVLAVYMLVIYVSVKYAVRKAAAKREESLTRLENGLREVFPDEAERKQWLLRQKLDSDFQAAFPACLGEKKTTWLGEKVAELSGYRDVKAA